VLVLLRAGVVACWCCCVLVLLRARCGCVLVLLRAGVVACWYVLRVLLLVSGLALFALCTRTVRNAFLTLTRRETQTHSRSQSLAIICGDGNWKLPSRTTLATSSSYSNIVFWNITLPVRSQCHSASSAGPNCHA
jgi:hypothetical protein